MEISDMETTEFSIKNEAALEDEPLIEGELPEWLQEMITEQEQPKTTDIDNEVIDNKSLGEESPTNQEPTQQKPSSDEDDTQEEDLMILNELDEEEAFLADIASSSKPEKVVDSGWFSEQDGQVEERMESNNGNFIFNENSDDIENIAAHEMAEDKTQPVKVSTDDEEPSSLTPEKSLIEDVQAADQIEPPFDNLYSIKDEKESSQTLEEPFFDDPFSEDEDFSSPPFGVPYEQETFTIDQKEEALPEIDETPDVKNYDVKDEDTLPSEKEETAMASREEIQFKETYTDENDDVLGDIKRKIEKGDFEVLVSTVNDQIDDPNHLDKLELWLREAAESKLEPKSELWETLGDINIKQNKPEEALNAYAKAIKHLLAK